MKAITNEDYVFIVPGESKMQEVEVNTRQLGQEAGLKIMNPYVVFKSETSKKEEDKELRLMKTSIIAGFVCTVSLGVLLILNLTGIGTPIEIKIILAVLLFGCLAVSLFCVALMAQYKAIKRER